MPRFEALARARRAMEQGHFDNLDPAGAQANALEAIAWSLIGLLERDQASGNEQADSGGLREAGESLTSQLRRGGFMNFDPRKP